MKKESLSRKSFIVFNVLFMIALMIVMIFPYINVLAKSLNDGADTMRGGITIFPRVFTWENYKTVISDKMFPRSALNSVVITCVGTIVSLIVQFMAAYAFLQKDLIGRGVFLGFLMVPMYFGGGLIPTYIMYSNMGILNNYLLYIIPGCFSLYNMIIIRTYMKGLPDSLNICLQVRKVCSMIFLFRELSVL